MKSYEINEETLILMPIDENNTKVYEKSNTLDVCCNSYKIMEDSCSYFGCSLTGRQDGSKTILGSGYKVPVIVEDSMNIIFFPTMSPTREECIWISLNNIKDIVKKDTNTIIIFDNNEKIEVEIPYVSLKNQIFRASRLESILKKRKKL